MRTRELILIGVFLTALAGLIWWSNTHSTESQPDHVLKVHSITQEAPTAAIKPTEAPIIFTESVENAVISVSEVEEEEVIVEEVETVPEPTEAAEIQDVAEEAEPENNMEYLGTWTISFYCNCPICCGEWSGGPTASGVYPTAWHTVACGSLPLGSEVYIDGLGYFTVEDRGVEGEWIDVYLDDHELCNEYGLQYRDVYLITE